MEKILIKNRSGVYKITCLSTNRIYIGSSIMCLKRKSEHFRDLRNNKHHCTRLQRAYNKHGKLNLVFEVIEYCNYDEIIQREQYYLNTLLFAQEYIDSKGEDRRFVRLGMNIKPVAGSSLGHKWSKESRLRITGRKRSEDTKAKISKAFKGENHPLFGTKLSEERKMNHSLFMKGRYVKDKNPFYGKRHSEESKMLLRLARKSNPCRSKPIICLNLLNGVFTDYPSIKEVAIDFKVAHCTISKKLRKNLQFRDKIFFYA